MFCPYPQEEVIRFQPSKRQICEWDLLLLTNLQLRWCEMGIIWLAIQLGVSQERIMSQFPILYIVSYISSVYQYQQCILYLLDVFINFNYVIVTIVRWSLRCQNDYPLGLGSLNPDPSACTVLYCLSLCNYLIQGPLSSHATLHGTCTMSHTYTCVTLSFTTCILDTVFPLSLNMDSITHVVLYPGTWTL